MKLPLFRALALCAVLAAAVAETEASGPDALEDGASLYEKCRADRAFCLGYVSGVADGRDERGQAGGWRSCFPETATIETIADAVVGWMETHSESRFFTARGAVAQAMAESFPCP